MNAASVNVFDWPGPDFLKFYAAFAAAVLALQWLAGRIGARGERKPDLSDPYLIAYLRGRSGEAMRVATLALIDRGLLRVEGNQVSIAPGADLRSVQAPIEQALLSHFEQPRTIDSLRRAETAKRACERYDATLDSFDLRPGSAGAERGFLRLALVILLLAGVAGTKLVIALQRGRTNVVFLIMLCVIAVAAAIAIWNASRRDRAGELLDDLRRMLTGLPVRAKSLSPGGATAELALLAAVFGMHMVPTTLFPARDALFGEEIAREAALRHRLALHGPGGSGHACGSVVSCGGGSSGCGGGGGCGGGCGGCGS